ncbi:MAG: hypothetical protein IT427_14070 [Pirellulales bacterium]|nr:hypothetical protein [Pirellulales bacterium]
MIRSISLATIAVIALTGTARAQWGWGWGFGGAATADQAAAMGMADLVNAAGSYNLQTSEAAINLEQARSIDLDNRLKGTQTFFQMRKINTESRRAEEGRRMTSEEAWRYAQIGAPKRVTPYQLDPVSGRIYWPISLQDPKYDEYRKQLDELFHQREITHGNAGFEVFTKIQDTTTAFLADLKKQIATLPSGEYVNAKNFIESLAHESRFPAA